MSLVMKQTEGYACPWLKCVACDKLIEDAKKAHVIYLHNHDETMNETWAVHKGVCDRAYTAWLKKNRGVLVVSWIPLAAYVAGLLDNLKLDDEALERGRHWFELGI